MKIKLKERSFSLKFDDLKAGDCFHAYTDKNLYMKIAPIENESFLSNNAVRLYDYRLEHISKGEDVSLLNCELVEI